MGEHDIGVLVRQIFEVPRCMLMRRSLKRNKDDLTTRKQMRKLYHEKNKNINKIKNGLAVQRFQ